MKGRKPTTITSGSSAIKAVPRPPALLSQDAKAEWKRVAPVLVERKILTDADLETLASYCTCIGMRNDGLRTIAAEGATFTTAAGMVKRHPAVGNVNDAMTLATRLAAELGLTPVSRSRAAIIDQADDEDDDLDL